MTVEELEARLADADQLDQAHLLGWLIAAVDEHTWREAVMSTPTCDAKEGDG